MNHSTTFEIAALVLNVLAAGEEVKLGGRRVVMGETDDGRTRLGCVASVWKAGADEPDETILALPVALETFFQWCEAAVAITHQVITAHDGTEIHAYHFPDDTPDVLRGVGYARALAALKAAHPEADSKYPVAVSGQGYSIHLAPLPPCTCGAEACHA